MIEDVEYQVFWTKSAVSDLERIVEYIAQSSSLTAKSIFAKLKKQIETLNYSPQRGRHIPELIEQGILLYRELVISPWRVMYRIHKRTVYILAIIDSRRNIEDILLKKLINI